MGLQASALIGLLALLVIVLVHRLSRPACAPKTAAALTPLLDAASPPPPPAQAAASARRGHEWIGGAVGFAERPGNTEPRYKAAPAPRNSTLLLIGVISGSKNFDVRNWVRRAFWSQRPWRLGISWRFVVGDKLPRGDNDRVSLHYESARHGDIDVVRGSELPPRQARVALRWWIHAAAQAAANPEIAPRYVGLTYDALLVNLPRVAMRLRALPPAVERSLGRSASSRASDRRSERMAIKLVYGGSLFWGAWADDANGETPMERQCGRDGVCATWRCVRAVAPAGLVAARLVGDHASGAPPPLSPTTRHEAEIAIFKECASGGSRSRRRHPSAPPFLAAAPELQILSTHLLKRARPAILHRLGVHQMEVFPPLELWEKSERYHQTSAGRTPAAPALLAAAAVARAVHNASGAHRGALTYLQLRAAVDVPPFEWSAAPAGYPGTRSLLARGVTDGIAAEAVTERFHRQRAAAAGGAGQMSCARDLCSVWGMTPPPQYGMCCEERP